MKYLLLLLGLLPFIGCQGPSYSSSRPYPLSYDATWETAYQVISRRYYIIKASKEEGTIETEWEEQMSVHYLDSYRHKVHVKVEEYQEQESDDPAREIPEIDEIEEEPPPTEHVVKVHVEKQQNRNIDDPAKAGAALWVPVGSDPDIEEMLINFMNSRLAIKAGTPEEFLKEPEEESPKTPLY